VEARVLDDEEDIVLDELVPEPGQGGRERDRPDREDAEPRLAE
jgi:hypothetical protein